MVWSRLKAVFPRWFATRSKSSEIAPVLAESIGPDEDFTRFIFTKNHFASEKGRVKPQALLPLFNDAKARYETSVHRIDGLRDEAIWALGYDHVENAEHRRVIRARGFGKIRIAQEAGLSTDVNGPPYPRHVDLVGWSPAPDDKDRRLMCATEIANRLQLEIDPRKRDPI